MLHYIQKNINFVSQSSMKKNLHKLLVLVCFIFIFASSSPSFSIPTSAIGSGIVMPPHSQQTTCPYSVRMIVGRTVLGQGGASIDGSTETYSPDVGCSCKINECRLSSSKTLFGTSDRQNVEGFTADLQFICIPSNDGTGSSVPTLSKGIYSTIKTINVLEFTDNSYWKSVAGSQGASETSKLDRDAIYYLDIFSSDSTRQVIPEGSTCKVNRNDKTGVAYWFYPGYFDIVQGKTPSTGTNVLVGGACASGAKILFTDVDLFGNEVQGTDTLFGCLPNSLNGLVAFIVRLVSGLAVIITFLIVLINLVLIISNSTNPDAIAEYQKKMTSAIMTLIGILLTITILSIFGIQIIGFGEEGIGGSLFRIFVGG